MASKVHMFVLNNFTRDTRVLREARALAAAGYEVTVFAELDANTPKREVLGHIEVVRIANESLLTLYERFLETPASRAVRWIERTLGRTRSARTPQREDHERDSARPAASTTTGGETDEHVHLVRRIYRRLRARVFHRSTLRRVARFERRYRFRHGSKGASVYHAHDLPMLPLACRAAHVHQASVVYDSHELFTEVGHTTAEVRQQWADLERAWIGQADAIITVCPSIGEELQKRYGVPTPTIVRNCCEPMTATKPHDRLREATGIDVDTPIILYQGGFADGRGLDSLIRAVHSIQRAALVLMGWGAIEDSLKRLVHDEQLEARISIIPPVRPEELLAWTACADIGVIPYQAVRLNNFYSCPNKLFEYINAGIPIAASDFPELRRVIHTYGVGCTFDPNSPEAIGQAIEGMLQDESGLLTMKDNARKAAKTLNWDVESQKLLSVYHDLFVDQR